MLDIIKGLSSKNNIDLYGLTGLKSCSCNSESGAFNIVIENLLKAMKEQNKNVKSNENGLSIEDMINTFNKLDYNSESLNVDKRIEEAIGKYSKKYGVDEKLIKSIIKVESNFEPNVVSEAGAQGLMQLMPETSRALGVTDPLNIEQNIEGGVKHIKSYIDRYNGNVEMALMAYNGGPTRMMNRGVTSISDIYKMPKETQNYVPKVMSYYRGL